jgi:nucleotide-binding universal stress UspA family protein
VNCRKYGEQVSMQTPPTSILVVTAGDGRDQAAIEMASRLALRNGARLAVAAVLSGLPPAFQRVSLVVEPAELWVVAALEHGRYLNTLVAGQSASIKIETRVLFGKKVEQIVREVSREKHDLVIVPGSPWTRQLLIWMRFDLSARLPRRCHCRVWTAESHHRDGLWRARGLDSVMAR